MWLFLAVVDGATMLMMRRQKHNGRVVSIPAGSLADTTSGEVDFDLPART
jgi:hypothetical protein